MIERHMTLNPSASWDPPSLCYLQLLCKHTPLQGPLKGCIVSQGSTWVSLQTLTQTRKCKSSILRRMRASYPTDAKQTFRVVESVDWALCFFFFFCYFAGLFFPVNSVKFRPEEVTLDNSQLWIPFALLRGRSRRRTEIYQHQICLFSTTCMHNTNV